MNWIQSLSKAIDYIESHEITALLLDMGLG